MKSEKIEKIVDLAATLASRADEFDQILIIYRKKDDPTSQTQRLGSFDNDLEARDALWLVEHFKHWLMSAINDCATED